MLFPSTLVVTKDISSIHNLLITAGHNSVENNPDILTVSDYSIENIRSISQFLSKTPYNHESKIVIIPNADLLSLESQNTLLKNLEEPGANNYFILLTTKPNSLISTVLSRCHKINLSNSNPVASNNMIFPNSIPEALLASDNLPKDKVELIMFLNNQIYLYKQKLISTPNDKISAIILKLIKAIQMLDSNVDSKSVADFLFLS